MLRSIKNLTLQLGHMGIKARPGIFCLLFSSRGQRLPICLAMYPQHLTAYYAIVAMQTSTKQGLNELTDVFCTVNDQD